MALVSPGVEVTVIDESQYIPSAVNTVPYFVVATAQNKVSADGVTVAAGTTAANANKTYLITSQRDLVATFGVPFFYNTTTGTPINGYELNEYGLLAAYSSLGVTNRAYIQRVDIDLTELSATLVRPTGEPANNTYWLSTTESRWGIFEWNQSTGQFTNIEPLVIIDPTLVVDAGSGDYTPLQSYGSIGDYAVVAITGQTHLQGWYKNTSNNWVLIGSDDWKDSWPTIAGTASPATLANGANLYLNDNLVSVGDGGTALTVAGFAQAINNAAIAGVSAGVVSGRLYIYGNTLATNDGSTAGSGIIALDPGPNSGAALLTALGLTGGEYETPQYLPSFSYQVPRWRTTDPVPAPTGSVWNNMSPVNSGISLTMKKYSTTLQEWVLQPCLAYFSGTTAINGLDPSGGGRNIPQGTTYVQFSSQYQNYDINAPLMAFQIYERAAIGQAVITGNVVMSSPTPFTPGDSMSVVATGINGSTSTGTVVIGGTGTVSDFLIAVSAANVTNLTAELDDAGFIVLTNTVGGMIQLTNIIGTPAQDAGFSITTGKVEPSRGNVNALVMGNWVSIESSTWTYQVSDTAPDQDPADGRLWYYSTASEVDIMIKDGTIWQGYQNVTNDVRGFDLSQTNANGPMVSPTAPTTQDDGNPLVYGDLWVDTSDLDNYPVLSRWQPVDGVDQWVSINTADQTTENGVLFADARWAENGTTDPVADPIPTIETLLTSNYLDLDAPDPALYPQGMLLFNTRRSGYNVKSFQSDYFNAESFPDDTLPAVTSTWLTASGNRDNGAMWGGRLAQRQLVVKALRSGIDTSIAAREEQNAYSLIATPGYPEVQGNMIALSNERNNTLFVVGDTPMRLSNAGNDLVAWATNNNGEGLATEDGNNATSNYASWFYPSCQTNDLSGNTVVQPPSHMMMRTILRSDAVSYPWLAPAGTRRGVVDNASSIGYIDAATGEFQQIGVSQAVRDILYERNINPITFIPGIGITNFGNKTSTTVTTALDRINVARLVAFLRGRLEEIGKLFLFEPNDEITRNEIAGLCNSLMIDLIAKRAIYDYLVVCDLSNNTPARIDRNELWVDIAIEPVKAAEFIYIPLRIKNTGEISGAAA